ncbi:hypothetical protein Tco_0523853 [Tanacetum coccineum]
MRTTGRYSRACIPYRSGKFERSYLISGLLGRLGIMTQKIWQFLKRDTPLATTVVYESMCAAEDGTIPPNSQHLCSDLQVAHTDVRILMLAWMSGDEDSKHYEMIPYLNGRRHFLSSKF